jgi:hypothetical protein
MSINEEPDYVIKAHDQEPSIEAILEQWNAKEGKWEAMDLATAKSVRVLLRKKDEAAAPVIATGSGEKEPGGVKGKIIYKWAKDDLKTPDDYDMEFKVVRGEGEAAKQQSIPNEDYYWLRVEEDLDKE